MREKNIRRCKNGHQYNKSSSCPICPICENLKKPKEGFINTLSAPARRALENNGISTLEQLSTYKKAQIEVLHGIGKSTMPKLEAALQLANLHFLGDY